MVYLVAIFRQIQGLNDLPTAPRTSVPLKAIADNASKPPAAERHPQGMGRIRYQTKVSYPICEPWCWNLSTCARTKSPSFVGKYTISSQVQMHEERPGSMTSSYFIWGSPHWGHPEGKMQESQLQIHGYCWMPKETWISMYIDHTWSMFADYPAVALFLQNSRHTPP